MRAAQIQTKIILLYNVNMIRKQKVQRNLFIANHAVLLLGLALIYYQTTAPPSPPDPLFNFPPILYPFLIMFLAIPLILDIASHSLYGLAHRPPFPYSLFVISKVLLCIALLAYWVAVILAEGREVVAETNALITLGIWIYPVLSIIVLTFPYAHKHSGDKYKKRVETQNL